MENAWDVLVLAAVLLTGAVVAIVVLAPLVFDPMPPGIRGARRAAVALVALTVVLLGVEWLVHH